MSKQCQNCKKAPATERENRMDLCKPCVERIARALQSLADDMAISQTMFGTDSGSYDHDEYWDRKGTKR
jgi:hypothetical protein